MFLHKRSFMGLMLILLLILGACEETKGESKTTQASANLEK